jgi:hypothetical protein
MLFLRRLMIFRRKRECTMQLDITQKTAAHLCERVWPIILALAERRYSKGELMLGELFNELGEIRYATAPDAN